MEIEVAGNTYLVNKMNARQQRNVLRRLFPLLAPTPEVVSALMKALRLESDESAPSEEEKLEATKDFFSAVGPLAKALSELTDDDTNYIFETCFAAVRRKVVNGWQALSSAQGDLQFQDVTLPQQMQIVFAVLRENYADFFPALPGQSNDAPVVSQ